jgi:hypothetical protein
LNAGPRGAVLFRSGRIARDVLEHRRDRQAEGKAYFVQPSSAYAVFAALIFLNLLKADARFLSEVILGHIHRLPSVANSIAEMFIDRVWGSGRRRTRFLHCLAELRLRLRETARSTGVLAMQAIFDLLCRQSISAGSAAC